jgi:hypothetical protein
VTALFSISLVISLALDAAVLFSSERLRRRCAAALVAVLGLAWVFLAVAVAQIASRTASALVRTGGARPPDLVAWAGHDALVVLASLGGPALLATVLGGMAIRASRRRKPRPGHMERVK